MPTVTIIGTGIRGPAGTPIGLSVSDYGATGNGTTDDTAAINACLAAATDGMIVFFPAGTYLLSKDVNGYMVKVTKKHITLLGQGRDKTILKVKNSAGEYVAVVSDGTVSGNTDISGLTVRDLTIDENQSNNTMADVSLATGPIFNGYPRIAIRCYNGTDGLIENVRFKDCDNVNTVAINGGATIIKRWKIVGCFFENTGVGTSHDHSSIYFHGTGVTVRDCVFTAGGAAAATAIETHGPYQVIDGNQVFNYLCMANVTGVSATPSTNIIVTNNAGRGLMVGIHLWCYDYGGISGFALNQLLVAHNQIEIDRDAWDAVVGFKVGILFNNGSSACARDVKIVDNQISWKPITATAVSNDNYSAGILWIRTVSVTEGTEDDEIDISRNTITGSNGPGIYYIPKLLTKRLKINDNMIVNPGSSCTSAAARVGILIDTVTLGTTSLFDVQISRNAVVDENGTHKVACAIDTQNISTLTDGRLLDNTLRLADGVTTLPVVKGDAASAWYCRQSMDVYVANTGVYTTGSVIFETSTGKEYRQTATPSGSTWADVRAEMTTATSNVATNTSNIATLNANIFRGSGSPEGAVTAPVGSIYHRSDGGTRTSLYVKESGSGNTGWLDQTELTTATTNIATNTSNISTLQTQILGRFFHKFVTGFYYSVPQVRGSVSNQVATLNQMYLMPFFVSETTTFDRIGITVSSGIASNTARLGIYADDGHGRPTGAALLDAGTVDTSAAASVEATISYQLTPGLYWVAMATQGGASGATVAQCVTPSLQVGAGSLANGITGRSAYSQTGVTGALPTYSASGAVAFAPVVALRVASVP
jgi:hypothetical protein